MTIDQLITYLTRLAERFGSQQDLADRLGVSPAYLSDVLHKKREPGEKILAPIGLKRVVIYERVDTH